MKNRFLQVLSLVGLLSASASTFAEPLNIAVTFDDLPYVWNTAPKGYSNKKMIQDIIDVLAKHKLKGVVAFINAGKVAPGENREILDLWVKNGHLLGNHVWNHIDLNSVTSAEYIADIDRNHEFLKTYNEAFVPYFRYPYLHEGNTINKRAAVRKHLQASGYSIAQVTIDHNDWEWYAPLTRCLSQDNKEKVKWLRESYNAEVVENLKAAKGLSQLLFQRQIKHIALMHPNWMTVEQLDQTLKSWRAAGATFVSLKDAMDDPAYKIDPNFIHDSPNTFFNQVRRNRALANPPDVLKIFKRTAEVENQLENACS